MKQEGEREGLPTVTTEEDHLGQAVLVVGPQYPFVRALMEELERTNNLPPTLKISESEESAATREVA